MEKNELLWRQYQQNIELYKFYMDLVIKINIFYYAITGAILSFFFKNTSIPNIKYSLFFPIIISIAFTAFFLYGAYLMSYIRNEVFAIRDALEFQVAPDVGVLTILLRIFSAVFCIVALGCCYILYKF